jgi:hypothetical protein
MGFTPDVWKSAPSEDHGLVGLVVLKNLTGGAKFFIVNVMVFLGSSIALNPKRSSHGELLVLSSSCCSHLVWRSSLSVVTCCSCDVRILRECLIFDVTLYKNVCAEICSSD